MSSRAYWAGAAEMELMEMSCRRLGEAWSLPGKEVTGQQQYYNGFLAQRPFSSWSHPDRSANVDRRAGLT